tara:strand:+ start:381 stop:695 length:315 start_codon:yes stop_codon:yes gene_type:complete
MDKKVVVGIVVVIIIILLGFAIYSFTGQVVTTTDRSCTDSDGGKNVYQKGTITNEVGTSYEDTCVNGKRLKEYYCGEGSFIFLDKIQNFRQICKCEDGVCVGEV